MIHREDIIHAARPLRWIFWGALLVLLDVSFTMTTTGTGLRLDLLDDTIGMLLITVAVGRLRHIHVDSSYANRMRFVHWVSIFMVLESFLQHFIFARPPLLTLFSTVISLATIVALPLFCACMRDVCHAATLPEAAGQWRRTHMLFLVLCAIPAGLLMIAGFFATLAGRTLHFDIGPGGGLLIVALFLISLISFFLATSTMARAAEAMPDSTPDTMALPRATMLHGR